MRLLKGQHDSKEFLNYVVFSDASCPIVFALDDMGWLTTTIPWLP